MANEAVIIELFNGGKPVRVGVADATAVAKGTICNLIDPRSTSGSSVISGDAVCGICAMEKVASDGSTELSVYQDGIFDLTAATNTTIAKGAYVSLSGANLIKTATEAEIAAGGAIGKALEAATSAEVIAVRVNL
jgi:predicted RecA/RadA family phage recombinase